MAMITESHYSFESQPGAFDGAISGGAVAGFPGASQYADLSVGGATQPNNRGASGGPIKSFITSLLAISAQNLSMRVEFHKKSYGTVVNTASFFPSNLIGWVNLVNAGPDTQEAAVATLYGTMFAWFVNGLSIPYEDADGNGLLHTNVVNMSDTAKSAGSAGYLFLRVGTVFAS